MKTALITGANKGIGFEIARQLGQQGFFIILTARSPGRGQVAIDQLETQGVKGIFIQMDVMDYESVRKAYLEVKEKVDQVDVLVNNAGILIDRQVDILKTEPQTAETTLYTNVLGPLWVTQRFEPLLKNGARVIMISSDMAAFSNEPGEWAPFYAISKTALNALTRQLSIPLQRKGIAVNCVSPGWVRTDMGGGSADLSVVEGADTAVWLATKADITLTGKFVKDREVIPW
ncbi:MAG: SDR family oxidoreductase [Bacteroidota bacterium]